MQSSAEPAQSHVTQVLLHTAAAFQVPTACCPAPAAPAASISIGYFSGFSHLLFAKMAELLHSMLFPGVFLLFLPGFSVQLAPLTASCLYHLGPHSIPRISGLRHSLPACLPARGCCCVDGGSAEGELPFGICYFVRINSQVGCHFPFQLREGL